MKKLLLLICLTYSLCVSAQLSNLPSPIGTYTAFRQNALPVSLTFPDGYAIPDTVRAEVWQINGTEGANIASVTPSVTVSGQNITITLSSAQVKKLPKTSTLYLIFDKVYVLSAKIITSLGTGTPSTIPATVSMPSLGNIKINLIGDPSIAFAAGQTALTAATASTTAASTATTKAAQAVSAAASIDPKVSARAPYGTLNRLRTLPDTSFKSFYAIDKGKEGTFVYNSSSTAADDSSTVIISGGRRFERVYEYLKPEQFGAIVNDGIDDGPAIQKMFNKATQLGLSVRFGNGEYLVGQEIKFKAVTGNPTYNYKLNITGEGAGLTVISGANGFTGNMFRIDSGATSGGVDNFITIQRIHFKANQASRIFYAVKLVGTKFYDNIFSGGEEVGIEIGLSGASESYSVYFKNNYHHGGTFNGGQNKGLLRLINARFFVIDGMETDGGKYGIEFSGNSDKNHVLNGKFEGAKKAAISITGGGGGGNNIHHNWIQPYIGHEPNAQFTGEMTGVEIVSTSGSNANNNISNNGFYTIPANENPLSGTISNASGTLSPKASGFALTGRTSGATGLLSGYNTTAGRWNIYVTSGTFISGEYVDQMNAAGTAYQGSFRLATIDTKVTYDIKLSGTGGYNIVSGNHLRGFPTYGVNSESDGNIILGNYIEALNGVVSSNNITIIGNRSYSPGGTSFNSTGGLTSFSNNTSSAGTNGISESYLFLNKMTTSQRDAISSPVEGQEIYNTTTHMKNYYNGSTWKAVTTD